jgi:hypothetical protein
MEVAVEGMEVEVAVEEMVGGATTGATVVAGMVTVGTTADIMAGITTAGTITIPAWGSTA